MSITVILPENSCSAVLRRHPERLRLVEASSPRELMDVDTPADLSR